MVFIEFWLNLQFCSHEMICLTQHVPIKKKKNTQSKTFSPKKEAFPLWRSACFIQHTKSLSLNSFYFRHCWVGFQLMSSCLAAIQLPERNGCLESLLLPSSGEVSVGKVDQSVLRPWGHRLLVLHKAAGGGKSPGWGSKWASGMLLAAWLSRQIMYRQLHSLPCPASQTEITKPLGLPRWDCDSQQDKRSPVAETVISGSDMARTSLFSLYREAAGS